MSLFRKARNAFELLREDGFHAVVAVIRRRYGVPIPQSSRSTWKAGIKSELIFWDSYFATKGLDWPEDYRRRNDPDDPLQPRLAALLPAQAAVSILDVGAGPLTYVGKKVAGKQLSITAVDPLAGDYDELLARHGIEPIVRTQPADAEQLTTRFLPESFDFVYARNCLDHSYDPERAITQIIDVTKPDCHALLEHRPNEGESEEYGGFHQWNFSSSPAGEFIISSPSKPTVNMTEKYRSVCTIICEETSEPGEGPWLVTRIHKHPR